LARCIEDFAKEDVLLVVEFLTYRLPAETPEAFRTKFADLIAGGTGLCRNAGAKVLKVPYPGSADACRQVAVAAGDVPWSVLSAGVDHAAFLGQVDVAMANGASGVIAGRAIWKDCVSLDRGRQRELLSTRARPRLEEIKAVIGRYRPWVAAQAEA
jgi:tagatose 1,6-diphosphate aldolase